MFQLSWFLSAGLYFHCSLLLHWPSCLSLQLWSFPDSSSWSYSHECRIFYSQVSNYSSYFSFKLQTCISNCVQDTSIWNSCRPFLNLLLQYILVFLLKFLTNHWIYPKCLFLPPKYLLNVLPPLYHQIPLSCSGSFSLPPKPAPISSSHIRSSL